MAATKRAAEAATAAAASAEAAVAKSPLQLCSVCFLAVDSTAINAAGPRGIQPIHLAAALGQSHIVAALLTAGPAALSRGTPP